MTCKGLNKQLTRKDKTEMKTKEELKALNEEIKALQEKLSELSPEELAQINGGDGEISTPWIEQKCPFCGAKLKYVDHDLDKGRDFWFCVICDTYLTYFWEGSRWERGKIED